MNYKIKKAITSFIAIILSVPLVVNCIFVGADELSNISESYNDEKAEVVLEDADSTSPEATATLDTVIRYDSSTTSTYYDLALDWGAMRLTYTFETNGEEPPIITGGTWGDSFNGINNQIKITNNSPQKIHFTMIYTITSGVISPSLEEYSMGITLSNTYDPTNTDAPYGSKENLNYIQEDDLEASDGTEKNANTATLYIYHPDDLYTKAAAGEISYPTEAIAYLKVGVITVEAFYVT